MANGLVDYLNDLRYVEVSNAGASAIPAFGLMRVTGASTTSGLVLTVDQPNADGQDVLINGPTPIIAGGRGVATYETPSQIYYDTADGTPANGETWGAGSGTYKLKKNKAGFTIQGGAANELVVAGRSEQSSGGAVDGTGQAFYQAVWTDSNSLTYGSIYWRQDGSGVIGEAFHKGVGFKAANLSEVRADTISGDLSSVTYSLVLNDLTSNLTLATIGGSAFLDGVGETEHKFFRILNPSNNTGTLTLTQSGGNIRTPNAENVVLAPGDMADIIGYTADGSSRNFLVTPGYPPLVTGTKSGLVSLANQKMGAGSKTFDAVITPTSGSAFLPGSATPPASVLDGWGLRVAGTSADSVVFTSEGVIAYNTSAGTPIVSWKPLAGGTDIVFGASATTRRFRIQPGSAFGANPYYAITVGSTTYDGIHDTLNDGTVVRGGIVTQKGTGGVAAASSPLGLSGTTVELSGTVGVGSGGTGLTSVTENGVMFGGSGGTSVSTTSAGSQYNVLTVNGSNTPVFGQVALDQSAAVTGELPGANVAVATTTTRGAVEMADAVADPASLTTTETADSTYDSTEEDMLNHLKADVTEIRTQLAALLSSLRSAGVLDT